MLRNLLSLLILGTLLSVGPESRAQSSLGQSLKDIEPAPHWIYDDLPAAFAEARTSGKPLLVVIRCVPCPPGRSLDGKVMQPDKDLEQLERQFVCVRIIQTNGLDLSVFQYDYDLSWAALFLNADRTIYGRYGSRNATGPASDQLLSPAGFRKAAERALKLHKAFPANKEQLAAKTSEPGPYRRPTEIPGLEDRPAIATTRQNCIHCHMLREYDLRAKWEQGELTEADLWVYPMPQRIGLTMDIDDGLVVETVTPQSAASQAGIVPGDELIAMNDQPLISIADIQWVLDRVPQDTRLLVKLRRNGQTLDKTIALSGDWKQGDIAWRASSWYGLRQGVKFDPLPDAERKSRGIDADRLALVVKGLFGRGGPKVREAGLRMNDIVVAIDDKTKAMTESDFLAYLRLNHGPQDSVQLTVLRNGRRQELVIPMW